MHQMHLVNSILNGEVEEDILMDVSDGAQYTDRKKTVCTLSKALNGLKQPQKRWNHQMGELLISIRFEASPADPASMFEEPKATK